MTATLKIDAGATKTDWLLISNGQSLLMQTAGINPMTQNGLVIYDLIAYQLVNTKIRPNFPNLHHIDMVEFFGAGCIESQESKMRDILIRAFAEYKISLGSVIVGSDIIGAARRLFGNDAGIACILGTGSNSCVYENMKIVANTHPLGYILGDEGSGAAIGRRLINNIYKGLFDENIKHLFEEETQLNYDIIINNVYHYPLANRFLASLSEFVGQHVDEYECLHKMVETEFQLFIDRNIEPYHRHDLKIGAVGGVAWHYRDILAATIARNNYQVGRIIKSPLGIR